jgi:hypothetical protein
MRIIWSFLVNSAAQRRLTHHLHFCSHDDAPNTLGFHTFTLCSTTGTSNSSDRLSHWIIILSSSHSLNGGGHLYVPSSVSGRNHVPFLGDFSQVCKMRERLHIDAMIHTSQVCKLENVSHRCMTLPLNMGEFSVIPFSVTLFPSSDLKDISMVS